MLSLNSTVWPLVSMTRLLLGIEAHLHVLPLSHVYCTYIVLVTQEHGVYSEGRLLLKHVESKPKLEAMAQWMREHMGVDASDSLSEVGELSAFHRRA